MSLDVIETPLSRYLKLISHKPTKRPSRGAVWAYSEEVKTKAIDLYRSGRPVKSIARELEANEKTLHGWIKKSGVWQRVSAAWSQEEKSHALELVEAYKSTARASRETGIPIRTIDTWTKAAGIKIIPFMHPPEVVNRGREMLREGIGPSEIGRELGVSPSTVRGWRRKL